jgi:hypothetical protein
MIATTFFAFRGTIPMVYVDSIGVSARHADAAHVRAFADRAARASLIRFLVWNDPNGCYSDRDHKLEFDRVATTDELRACVHLVADEMV